MSKIDLNKLNGENPQRVAVFNVEKTNEETRTVELALSSEEPVERWFGTEILDHGDKSINLGRLLDGAPLLVGHNHDDQVGKVENASIDTDRVARAVVRFGKSARACEIFDDVKDGIREKVSVGYRIDELVEDETSSAENPVYRATRWTPYEVSIVSVPADNSVGIGRASNLTQNEKTIMPQENNTPAVETATPAPAVDVRAEVETATRNELDRIDTIRKMGEQYGCEDLARQHINDKSSVAEVTTVILANVGNRSQNTESVAELGMDDNEVRNYSLFNAVRAATTGDWSKAGAELEASQAIAEKLGRDARGFFVPAEIQQRDMTAGTGSAGGFMVGTDHLGGSFIDALRAQALCGQLGATFLDGLVGNVDIPRLSADGAFAWLAEDGDATDDDATLSQVLLSPKTIGGAVPMSRRLLKQSSPSVEAMIMNSMAQAAALAVDLGALAGTGAANQPTGIVNTTGVATQAIVAAGAPTHAELVGFETKVADANGLVGNLNFVTTAGVRGTLKTTAKDSGSGIMLGDNNMANGYDLNVSTQLAANRMIFGNFADLVIGMWGVLDIMPDQATKAASGGLVMRAFQDVDVAVRNPGSFCVNA